MRHKRIHIQHISKLIFILLVIVLYSVKAYAQPQPPKPFSIYTNPAQGLFFGAFYHGLTGGSVIIYPDGSRSTTGDVVQVSMGQLFSPAIIEVEAPIGTRVAILNGPDVVLTGSNGGSMLLKLGVPNVGTSFITTVPPPGRNQVRIGGTLYVGNSLANPVGAYSGIFSVTFIQE
jgi:hypothetical protein